MYKVKYGKKSQYLKDDSELKQFLCDWAKEHRSFKYKGKEIPENEWKKILENILEYDENLTQTSNNLEIPKQNCHQLISFLHEIKWEQNKYSMKDILEKLKTHFKTYEIEGAQEEDIEGEMAGEETPKPKKFVTFKMLKKAWEVPYSFFNGEETAKGLEAGEGEMERKRRRSWRRTERAQMKMTLSMVLEMKSRKAFSRSGAQPEPHFHTEEKRLA